MNSSRLVLSKLWQQVVNKFHQLVGNLGNQTGNFDNRLEQSILNQSIYISCVWTKGNWNRLTGTRIV